MAHFPRDTRSAFAQLAASRKNWTPKELALEMAKLIEEPTADSVQATLDEDNHTVSIKVTSVPHR